MRDTEGAGAAAAFAGRVLGSVSAALIIVTLLIGLFMPLVMSALAPGFAGTDTLRLAVDDARLMLPYLAFAGPATVMLALASAQGRFGLTAFSPLLFNIALIAVMVVLMAAQQQAAVVATVLAATVGIAGLLQLLILTLRRRDGEAAAPLRVSFDAEMRGFFAAALPAMVANSGPQLLAVTGAIIASASPSAVSWLYFANRLIELPLGIVGVAMGTVLVPELTRALRNGGTADVAHAELRGLELAVGLALPAMLGLIVLAQPIARLLFEHGAFTATDAAATAEILIWLSLGLPAHVLVKALSPAFFAREDTMAPLLATVKGAVVAIVLAVLLGHFFGPSGNRGCAGGRRLEQRGKPDPPRPGHVRFRDRCGGATAAATPGRGGAVDGGHAVAWHAAPARPGHASAFPAASRRPGHADRRRSGELRPVPPAFRRHRLARGGHRDAAAGQEQFEERLARLGPAWQTTAPQQA